MPYSTEYVQNIYFNFTKNYIILNKRQKQNINNYTYLICIIIKIIRILKKFEKC